MSQLISLGLSYKTAPVEIREQLAPSEARQKQWLTQTAAGQLPGITGLVVISTCNRTELYAVVARGVAAETLFELLAECCPLPKAEWEPLVYQFEDQACVQHLMSVAAGLDSQVIGEPQILGQITDSYQQAVAFGAAGPVLSALMKQAIHAGKRVRHETELSRGALSISSIAARHASEIAGSLDQASVLVIGAGKMARSAMSSMVKQGVGKLVIANRTFDHAYELAQLWNGTAIPFEQLHAALADADIVIAAAAAPEPLIAVEDIRATLHERGGRPLLIFDIALPRIVAPGVDTLAGVHLYNLDDLEAAAEAHRNERQNSIPAAERIIQEEAQEFLEWQASRAIVPVIQQLHAQADAVREAELAQLMRRLPKLEERDRQLLDEFSHRLINKLFHRPTVRLKAQSAEGHAALYTSVIDDLFGLDITGQESQERHAS